MNKKIALGIFALVACAYAASSPPAANEPTLNQIQAAFNAQSRCELADPAGLLAEFPLALLSDTQNKAMHADAVQLTKLAAAGDIALTDYLLARRLRIRGQFDLSDVFAIACRAYTSKAQFQAWTQLKPSDALVIADFAWVPLLSREQEYLGPGLVFVRENNQWRYLHFEFDAFGSSASTAALLQSMRKAAAYSSDDDAAFVAACPMPKAPQPQLNFDLAKAYERDISEEIYRGRDWDQKNALGALQRAAVRRHAEGKQVAPSAVAQLLFAEVLIRSLEFDSAPPPESAQWLSRVIRAQQFFDQAHARGANLARFLPLIPWLAEVNLKGIGAHPIDIAKAQQLYKIAANSGDEDATWTYARFKTTGFADTPVDCAGALEMLKKNTNAYSEEKFAFENALLITQCADANFREKNKALVPTLLKKVDAKYFDADDRSEFEALQAFVHCKSSEIAGACVAPQPKFQQGTTQARLIQAKLAGQNSVPSQRYPGRLPKPPEPELLRCD